MRTLNVFELIDEYSRLDDERQELRSLLEAAKENLACFEGTLNILDASEEDLEKLDDLKYAVDAADEELVMWNEENLDRYNKLEDLPHEWKESMGTTAISEDDMAEYARDLFEVTSGIDIRKWPYHHIDWEDAAKDLMCDMESVYFEGETFYIV